MKMLLTLVAVAVLAPAAPAPPVSAPPRDLPAVLDQAVRDGYPGVLAYARQGDHEWRYAAGVGRKRHDEHGQELAVATEPAHQGKGLARRLVAQATRRVLDEGAVATYLHAPDNVASARVADASGFPDRGWSIYGLPTGS